MINAELLKIAESQNSPFGVEVNYIEAVTKNTDTDTYIGKKFKKVHLDLTFSEVRNFRHNRNLVLVTRLLYLGH